MGGDRLRFGMGGRPVHPNITRDEMSRQKNRGRPSAAAPSPADEARNELFQHIMSCGVIGSAPEHQKEWFDETMQYMTERYPELNQKAMAELRVLGERFAAPPVKKAAPASDAPEGELDAVNAA